MKNIKIEWKGKKIVILESDAFELGEAIEEVVSLTALAQMAEKPQFHKLARCFSIMINYGGGVSTPSEVHKLMMQQVKDGGEQGKAMLVVEAVQTLITILMDGAPTEADGADTTEGKPPASSSKVASA